VLCFVIPFAVAARQTDAADEPPGPEEAVASAPQQREEAAPEPSGPAPADESPAPSVAPAEVKPAPAAAEQPVAPAETNPEPAPPVEVRGEEPAPAPPAPAKPAVPGCGVQFARSPAEAAKEAARDRKLTFILHISGNFEDAGFT
jgi:hypothetical protein